MQDILASMTSLPNLHPALVHFPVAFLTTGLLVDLVGLLAKGRRWVDRLGASLWVLGLVGGLAAYLAGRSAAGSLTDLPVAVEPVIAGHSDWALYTLVTFGCVAAVRLVCTWKDRERERLRRHPLRWAALVIAAFGQLALFETADRGGELVYQHAVAVRLPAVSEPAFSNEAAGEPATALSAGAVGEQPATGSHVAGGSVGASPLIREGDGVLTWRPSAGDVVPGPVLRSFSTAGSDAVRTAPPPPPRAGVRLAVDGRQMLVLGEMFSDVAVEVRVALDQYTGRLALVHHARGSDTAEWFEVSADGRAALVRVTAGQREVLDEKASTLPLDAVTLEVSASGRHFKGKVNGKMVVHGHAAPLPAGRVGLLLDGRGALQLESLRVTPLARH